MHAGDMPFNEYNAANPLESSLSSLMKHLLILSTYSEPQKYHEIAVVLTIFTLKLRRGNQKNKNTDTEGCLLTLLGGEL